jgi:hypothetical protein
MSVHDSNRGLSGRVMLAAAGMDRARIALRGRIRGAGVVE